MIFEEGDGVRGQAAGDGRIGTLAIDRAMKSLSEVSLEASSHQLGPSPCPSVYPQFYPEGIACD